MSGIDTRFLEENIARAEEELRSLYGAWRLIRGDSPVAPAPGIEARHVAGCRVLPDRYALLDELPKGAVLAEVGVDKGLFSRAILERCRPRELHMFDLSFVNLEDPDFFEERRRGGQVALVRGDSQERLAGYPAGFFDAVYLDADHAYQGVRRDARQAARTLKPGGLLLFNDFTNFSPLELQGYGVYRAVLELCRDDGWEMAFLALHPYCYHDVALRRADH